MLAKKGKEFFFSFNDLGARLSIDRTVARRITHRLIDLGIFEIVTLGTQGINGKATTYRWLI